MLYEGGVRVAMIARWPGHIAADTTTNQPVISVDLLPTLAELAGARLDRSIERDGVSITPLFDDAGNTVDREALYWHFPGYLQANSEMGTWRTTPAGAIRVGDYKLIEFFEDDRRELYHLATDSGQQYDLAATLPDVANELHVMLIEWRNRVDAPLPALKVECFDCYDHSSRPSHTHTATGSNTPPARPRWPLRAHLQSPSPVFAQKVRGGGLLNRERRRRTLHTRPAVGNRRRTNAAGSRLPRG